MNCSRRLVIASFAAWLLLAPSTSWGRTWTNTEGKTLEAEWLGLADGKVQLKRSDGKTVSVPLNKLSADDQEFARQRSAEAKGGNAGNPAVAEVPQRPMREPPRKGSFAITAEEGIPSELFAKAALAAGATLKPEFAEAVRTKKAKGVHNNDKSVPSWQVYVPGSYDDTLPYGVLAYVNSGDSGGIVGGWQAVLDKHRIIWVGADKSGNSQPTSYRYALAVDGVRRIQEKYQIDPQRIYLSGNSGGGRICSQLMLLNADLFTGGYPHIGCNPYRNLPLPDGKFLASKLQVNPKLMKQASRQNRYVFLTGEKDFNRDHTRLIFNQYKSDGFQNVTYLEVPGMEHSAPNAEWFEKGIVALDAPLTAAAKTTFSNAAKNEKGGQLGAALEGYARAAAHGGDQEFAAEAKTKADALLKQYDEEVAKVEELIQAGNATEAKTTLAQLRRRWGKGATEDAQRLDAALRVPRK
ncbi:MAG: hypothetical protein K8T91_18985 [Planctomycetes bacterium]|nr:hypothetical protein [Planctomycetota bacterium]